MELRKDAAVTLDELQAFLKERLSRYKMPKFMALVDQLPRTAASGKIQKFILKERFGRPEND